MALVFCEVILAWVFRLEFSDQRFRRRKIPRFVSVDLVPNNQSPCKKSLQVIVGPTGFAKGLSWAIHRSQKVRHELLISLGEGTEK